MKTHPLYARALLAVFAVVAVSAFLLAEPGTGFRDQWLPSSFNPGAQGHKALFVTLQHLQWPVARWHGGTDELSGTGQVLVLTRDESQRKTQFSEGEIHGLLSWVRAGNTLVLAGNFWEWPDTRNLYAQGHFILPEAAKSLSPPAPRILPLDIATITLLPSDASTSHERLSIPATKPLPPVSTGSILWKNGDKAYVAQGSLGAGSIFFLASPHFLDNQWLKAADNLPFIMGIFQPGGHPPAHLWFEESHHGYRMNHAVSGLVGHKGVQLALWQAALGILVFASSQLYRLGPVIHLDREPRRSSLDFVNAMARLYRRANIRNQMVGILFQQTHTRVLSRFHLPPNTSHDVISARLAQAFPHLPVWKKLAQRFDSSQTDIHLSALPPSGWLKLSRDLIRIKKEML